MVCACWPVCLQVSDARDETVAKGTHHCAVPQASGSLARVPCALCVTGSPYVCFLCNVHFFHLYLMEEIEESLSVVSNLRKH